MTSTSSTKRPTWKSRLEPWAQRWADLYSDADAVIRASTDDELAQLESDVAQPGMTNSWFATYHVAREILAPLVKAELLRRSKP